MGRVTVEAATYFYGAIGKRKLSRQIATHLTTVVIALSAAAPAVAIDWDGNGASPPSGTYGTANNWNPDQVPSSGNTATFNVNDTYTVTFGANASPIGQLDVQAGNVTFASTGTAKTLPVTSGGTRDVTITGGATLELGSFGISPIHLTVGGELTVEQGAILYNNSQITANGNVTIDSGQISSLPPINGPLNMASGRTMTVINGGSFYTSGSYATSANATYNISGESSSIATSSLSISSGAAVNVASGGLLTAGSALNIGNTTNGTLTVDGETTFATALMGAVSQWGTNGGDAFVTFTNLAGGDFIGGLDLSNSAIAGTTAVVNVLSGAAVTSGRLRLAYAGGATTSATLNLQGDGSTFTLSDSMNNFSFLGHASQGAAQLNVGTTASGATFNAYAEVFAIEPTGTLSVGSPATAGSFFAPGGMSVKGDVNLAGGDMTVDETLTIDPVGDFNFTGGTLRVVNIAGSLQNDGGTLAPGFVTPPIGTLAISGNYDQAAQGILQIEFGSSPTSFDKLQPTGSATLGGTLEVVLRDRVPVLGETFEIITANAGLSGEFQLLSVPELSGNMEWEIIYDADSVTLKIIEVAGASGDYNNNGVVNAADYVVWRKFLSYPSFNLPNEGSVDGTVSRGDYRVWRSNYGEVNGLGAAHGAAPEPSSMLLCFFAALAVHGIAFVRVR